MFDIPVLVVGDVMLDRHVYGNVRRISPEAPVPVVSLAGEVHTPGGAGNVAATLAGLGAAVTLAGLVGADVEASQLREALDAKGVNRLVLHEESGLQTITKTRILSEQPAAAPAAGSRRRSRRLCRCRRRTCWTVSHP